MSALESLPNELIGRIFDFAPDVQTAVSLSATNRKLAGIWLQNTELFVTEILKPKLSKIVAYEQAVDLAMAEERLEGQLRHSAATNPPMQYYAARLLRNDELARSTASAFRIWVENQDADSFKNRRELPSDCPYTACYLLRKFVLAYRHTQAGFRSSLLDTLRKSSPVTLRTNADLATFLCFASGEDERIKQGIPIPKEDWPIDNEYAAFDLPEWDYAGDVVHDALGDYLHGTARLERSMNYIIREL